MNKTIRLNKKDQIKHFDNDNVEANMNIRSINIKIDYN